MIYINTLKFRLIGAREKIKFYAKKNAFFDYI